MMNQVHFIGIGGTGLSALARVLVERGVKVTGSDRQLSALALDLVKIGVKVCEGHDPSLLQGADLVVRSSAVPDNDPEVKAALQAGIPVLKRSEFLDRMLDGYDCIAIAGTHGKTTTTAMTAWMLHEIGLDPSFVIGGVSENLGTNAHHGSGKYFVIEADEYDRMFLGLHPQVAIVTYVEHDHPDCFPSYSAYLEAFSQFVRLIKPGGKLLYCQDNKGARVVQLFTSESIDAFSYGVEYGSAYEALDIKVNEKGSYSFRAVFQEHEELAIVDLQVPGLHNVRNALGALAAVHQLGLPLQPAASALGTFTGTGRRFDILGEAGGVTIIDDYAHHPTELKATLEAARSRYPDRHIWVVWQPHTYSRTQSLLPQFVKAFGQADHLIVTAIYAAREKDNGFTANQVVEQMFHPDARYIPALDDVSAYLVNSLKSGDVLLVCSAGDADNISKTVLKALSKEEVRNA
ncbi:MAG TPA: UDP-N-acetylmuramate--L-alanine ligase [Longilinea sp.]|nr:UDP-N-acetylmuramate--L-alanine ligase [Longilinea sp.]